MLAQRQPPFKECVTAHWPSGFAPKMIGAQVYYRSYGFFSSSDEMSDRGAFCPRLKLRCKAGWTRQK